MNSDLIKHHLVKKLGDEVIGRINDMKDDNRSSFLEPIVYSFHKGNNVGYTLNNEVIPIPDDYNNWQVFNNYEWELICKYDEKALSRHHYNTTGTHNTTIDIRYKIHFDGNENIEEVFKIIEQHPSYGQFEGIKLLYGFTYELVWGT